MAYGTADFYLILSHGLHAGTAGDGALTDNERYVRVLSDGLLDIFPSPVAAVGEGFFKLAVGGARMMADGVKIFLNLGRC